jgi:predicted transcriptional regulator
MKAKKPLGIKEIEKLANATSIHSHISKLKELKLIKKDEDGKFMVGKLGRSKMEKSKG